MGKIDWLNKLADSNINYNLGAGIPPLELYPNFNPADLLSSSISPINKMISYHSTQGFILETASKVLEINESISIDSKNIVITNGVQEAIAITIACFKSKTIACLDPSYPGFIETAESLGCKVIIIQQENWLSEIQKLPEESLFYISSDFSNPLGISLNSSEREILISIASRNNFFIFDDTTYRPFNINHSKPSLFSLNKEHVIHAISFSKILAPGLRSAFVYLPSKLINKFISKKANMSLNNSGITQIILESWLIQQNFSITNHLGLIKSRLIKNSNVLKDHGINYDGGFFCSMVLNHKVDFQLCDLILLKENIGIVPMSLFTNNVQYENHMRLCIANIEDNDLHIVLNKLKNFNI
jgi:DNA-binding transcriptional MocR family regulator